MLGGIFGIGSDASLVLFAASSAAGAGAAITAGWHATNDRYRAAARAQWLLSAVCAWFAMTMPDGPPLMRPMALVPEMTVGFMVSVVSAWWLDAQADRQRLAHREPVAVGGG